MRSSISDWFAGKTNAMVALSGGVDSALVAYAAHRALGSTALAVTADYKTLAREEMESAVDVAIQIGIKHHIIRYNELHDDNFTRNDKDRCFHCRTQLGEHLTRLASRLGYSTIVDGTNTDDASEYRPGIRALHSRGIRSPLLEMGIAKAAVRRLAREAGLRVYNRPSNSCLASRIPWGSRVTSQKLARIEMAERYVQKYLPRGSLRVRDTDEGARIEVGAHMMQDLRRNISHIRAALVLLGFTQVSISPHAYRPGGANL